jgi:2-polyprenyl-3-methyl-5-hydroxy-6-metoxy-1,4-benzoquinol methylase
LNNNKIHENISGIPSTESFDTITLWHVLEHVPQPQDLIAKLSSHLDKTGTLFIAVPNHKSYDAKHYESIWAGYDVPRHLWHFNKSSMQTLLAKSSLKIVDILPMKLDSYYVSMLSEKYRNKGNTTVATLIRAITTGLKSNVRARKDGEYSSLIYVIKK